MAIQSEKGSEISWKVSYDEDFVRTGNLMLNLNNKKTTYLAVRTKIHYFPLRAYINLWTTEGEAQYTLTKPSMSTITSLLEHFDNARVKTTDHMVTVGLVGDDQKRNGDLDVDSTFMVKVSRRRGFVREALLYGSRILNADHVADQFFPVDGVDAQLMEGLSRMAKKMMTKAEISRIIQYARRVIEDIRSDITVYNKMVENDELLLNSAFKMKPISNFAPPTFDSKNQNFEFDLSEKKVGTTKRLKMAVKDAINQIRKALEDGNLGQLLSGKLINYETVAPKIKINHDLVNSFIKRMIGRVDHYFTSQSGYLSKYLYDFKEITKSFKIGRVTLDELFTTKPSQEMLEKFALYRLMKMKGEKLDLVQAYENYFKPEQFQANGTDNNSPYKELTVDGKSCMVLSIKFSDCPPMKLETSSSDLTFDGKKESTMFMSDKDNCSVLALPSIDGPILTLATKKTELGQPAQVKIERISTGYIVTSDLNWHGQFSGMMGTNNYNGLDDVTA
ncbi:hypothetical protein Ciccas_002990 [Cichlidogyrus casuarinus]|uniref:Uncharacterized protein n=1 Tax=Cichlidogyrus casuarinus TaxID=1844966 RepID=A0ABD2QGM3_9PLAT